MPRLVIRTTIAQNGESQELAGRVADVLRKSVDDPDDVVEFPNVRTEIVHLGDLTVGRMVNQPGWRWSQHVRPTVGGQWCQVRHVGFMISGRLGLDFPDGSSVVFGPGDVFDIPPGHDGYTVGDEPIVQIEWSGLRHWAGFGGGRNRVLATLLFVDVVSSTEVATRLGDAAWRDLLSQHFEAMRAELERFGGREVKTTGDGMLVTFDGSARAVQCAAAIRRIAREHDLQVRIGVHVGEVEIVGDDVRGVTVHEAARIMAAAAPGEIIVSELARMLAGAAGLAFNDRGTRELKGLEGEWRLAAVVEVAALPG
jgi:class 3 adenylate cyclase